MVLYKININAYFTCFIGNNITYIAIIFRGYKTRRAHLPVCVVQCNGVDVQLEYFQWKQGIDKEYTCILNSFHHEGRLRQQLSSGRSGP